jgi:hypothetical protein
LELLEFEGLSGARFAEEDNDVGELQKLVRQSYMSILVPAPLPAREHRIAMLV